jgi:hypothetical protein
MTQNRAPTQPNDSAPNTGTSELRLNSWEEDWWKCLQRGYLTYVNSTSEIGGLPDSKLKILH